MNDTKSVHLAITGHVQGVFFRRWLQERAQRQGVDGWVRNRDDGAVEAVLSGPPEAIEALVAAAREGPPAARVESVAVEEAEPLRTRGFEVTD